MLDDTAILTGGKVISETLVQAGCYLKNDPARPGWWLPTRTRRRSSGQGSADGQGQSSRSKPRSTDYPDDREKLQERMAKLSGGVAVIKVEPQLKPS